MIIGSSLIIFQCFKCDGLVASGEGNDTICDVTQTSVDQVLYHHQISKSRSTFKLYPVILFFICLGWVFRQVRNVGGGASEDDLGVHQQDGAPPGHHGHQVAEGLRHRDRDGPRQRRGDPETSGSWHYRWDLELVASLDRVLHYVHNRMCRCWRAHRRRDQCGKIRFPSICQYYLPSIISEAHHVHVWHRIVQLWKQMRS